MKPLRDFVIIETPEGERSETASGIILTQATDEPIIAKVLDVGPECKSVIVGEEVVFYKKSVYDLTLKGEKISLISEKDILGII